MTGVQFLRIEKLKKKNILLVAAKHNLREIQAEIGVGADSRIDGRRSHLNYVLRGPTSAIQVPAMAQAMMDEAGIARLRKDAVRGLEIVFCLPPTHMLDAKAFFEKAVDWAGSYFQVPVLSAVVHNDEAAPHCHVLLLPLLNGRMVGSDLLGNRTRLQAIQMDFHANVGKCFGLLRQAPQAPMSAASRRFAAEQIFELIKSRPAVLDTTEVKAAMLELIRRNPESMLHALGMKVPKQLGRKKTFVEIMTAPCKPEKPIGITHKKPIGFNRVSSVPTIESLSCVGFDSAHADTMGSQSKQGAAVESTREREGEFLAAQWNEATGEFMAQPAPQQSNKLKAEMAVRDALMSEELDGNPIVLAES